MTDFRRGEIWTHERNALDFWQAKAKGPASLLLYIHGGGWRSGDKSLLTAGTLKFILAHQNWAEAFGMTLF